MYDSENTIVFSNPCFPYYEFTNCYPSEFELVDKTWPTVEHYYHAIKFFPDHMDLVELLRTTKNVCDVQEMADLKREFIRKDWKEIHMGVMYAAVK